MVKIGAHVSAAVSLDLSIERALHIGAESTQIFVSPPQQWLESIHDLAEIEAYIQKVRASGIGPNFIHGTYLINLASTKAEHIQKSIDWLIYAMKIAQDAKIAGVIFHIGSHKGLGFDSSLSLVVEGIKKVLAQPLAGPLGEENNRPYLILENCAGSGGTIGCNFHELGQIIKQVQDNRLRVCLDTQHAFASGYDLRTKEGVEQTLAEFKREIGLDKLAVIHANDSKMEFNSKKDRHENIGEGLIGKDGFSYLIQALNKHPETEDISLILEVPGFAGTGPDKENVQILKSLRDLTNKL